jgi:hypothetical protein
MESRETRIYVVLSFVTAFICIILEGMVLKALSDEAASVYDSMQQLDDGSLKEEYSYIDLSLGRVRDENIFFIVYQIFQTYYGIDSVIVYSYSIMGTFTNGEVLKIIPKISQLTSVYNLGRPPKLDSIACPPWIYLFLCCLCFGTTW